MIVVASGATATEATASPPPGPVPSELSQPMSTSDQTSTGEAARRRPIIPAPVDSGLNGPLERHRWSNSSGGWVVPSQAAAVLFACSPNMNGVGQDVHLAGR